MAGQPPAPTTPPTLLPDQLIPPHAHLPLNFNSSAKEWEPKKTSPSFVLDVMHNLLNEIVKADRVVDFEGEYGLARMQLRNIQLFTKIICNNYYREEELDSTKTKKSTPPMRNIDTQTERPSYAEAATQTSTVCNVDPRTE
ncbi:hypothetical protein BDZ91DRAFT_798929 [Kalaharituber pfeilii]|nr:hypothetical protein BDZ91DRAFT_798929 [Kalaharituber pfeilii]